MKTKRRPGIKKVPGLRPGEKSRRDAEAIADGDESFPLDGLPRVDLRLLSPQEADFPNATG